MGLRDQAVEIRVAAGDLAQTLLGILTSKRTRRNILNTALLTGAGLLACVLSIVAYLAFYHLHLPDQVTTVPIYLQYGYGINPYGIASLGHTNIVNLQPYDIVVSLKLPRSTPNSERGNFMVAMQLLDGSVNTSNKLILPPPYDGGCAPTEPIVQPDLRAQLAGRTVLYSATRPSLVPYTHWLVALAARAVFMPYYVLVPRSDAVKLDVGMAERVTFGRGMPLPRSVLVEIQAGQSLQAYEATVTLTAQLHGLRWFMYNWRVTAFLIFTPAFWFLAMVVTLVVFALPLRLVISAIEELVKGPETDGDSLDDGDASPVKKEEDDLSDTDMTFPSSSKQPPLKYEKPIKEEDGDETLPVPGAVMTGMEADDETSDDGRGRDSGIGTSYSDNMARGGTRKRSTKGGSSGSRGS